MEKSKESDQSGATPGASATTPNSKEQEIPSKPKVGNNEKGNNNTSCAADDAVVVVKEPEVMSQNTASLKTLSYGHGALQKKLQLAILERTKKETILKDLTADLSQQKERNRLAQEKHQLLSDKLFSLKTAVDRNEKRQDSLYSEISDVKWKMQSSNQLLTKFKNEGAQLKIRAEARKKEFEAVEDPNGEYTKKKSKLKEDIQQLKSYKQWLEEDSFEVRSIMNGNKMLELEQRIQAVRDALEYRNTELEKKEKTLRQKEEQVESKKKSLEDAKKRNQAQINQLTNQLRCARETESKLKRSNDYLRQKIDYGMNVPAKTIPEHFQRKR